MRRSRTVVRVFSRVVVFIFIVLCAQSTWSFAETLGREGAGWLERVDGYLVLHLKGTPYEMGVQHGKLLRNHVRENMKYLLQTKADESVIEAGPIKVTP